MNDIYIIGQIGKAAGQIEAAKNHIAANPLEASSAVLPAIATADYNLRIALSMMANTNSCAEIDLSDVEQVEALAKELRSGDNV